MSIRHSQIRTSETGVYNVKSGPFNAKGDGTTDDTAAIQAAIDAAETAGGGVVYLPPGTYAVYSSIVKKPKAIWIKGAGPSATIIKVASTSWGNASSFPLPVGTVNTNGTAVTWASGVTFTSAMAGHDIYINSVKYVISSVTNSTTLVLTTTAGVQAGVAFEVMTGIIMYNDLTAAQSGGVSDLAIAFYQPDSATRADYIHWPAAIAGTRSMLFRLNRVQWFNAWNGVWVHRGNGIQVVDCFGSWFNHAFDIDGLVDSSWITRFAGWVFATRMAGTDYTMTTNQNTVFLEDADVYAFWIGKADDLHIEHCLTVSTKGANIHVGAEATPFNGDPWLQMTDVDFDQSGIEISAGQLTASSLNLNPNYTGAGPSTKNALLVTGTSRVTIGASRINNVNCTVPLVDVNLTIAASEDTSTGAVILSGCSFVSFVDEDIIYVHSTGGSVQVTGSRFIAPLSQGAAYASNILHSVGTGRIIATGNVVTDKKGNTGSWLNVDTDAGHQVVGNFAPGWSETYPATQKISRYDNMGVNNRPIGSAVTSGDPITPTGRFFHVTGANALSTIVSTATLGGTTAPFITQFTVIPDGAFTWNSAGNIAISGTAVVGRAITFTYDDVTTKWYPSYV